MPSVSEQAHDRLYPSLTDPNYLVLRARRLIFERWIGELENRPLTILDLGAKYQPYRPLLEGRIGRYVALDLEKNDLVTVVGDGHALPFKDETFDLILLTQVLDSFADPFLGVRQMHRVLRPRGVLFASVPFVAPTFAPFERWRFSREGIRTLMAPFERMEIVPEVHSLGGLLRSLHLGAGFLLRYQAIRALYRYSLCPVVNLLGRAVEGMHLTSDESFTPNYSVRAVKGCSPTPPA